MDDDHAPRQNSPDSSTAAALVVGMRCPQCPSAFRDESSLGGHLLSAHNMRLVVAGSTASSSLSSSPLTDDSSRSTASCPVCRRQVDDLPQHFAAAHCDGSVAGATTLAQIGLQLPATESLREKLERLQSDDELNFRNARTRTIEASEVVRVKIEEENEAAMNLSVKDNNINNNNNNVAEQGRRRRKAQTSVPERNKDQRYWARRVKNNEAAKRSRDLRIQREKIIFDENARLEAKGAEMATARDRLSMDNKELRLKMDLILEENARLKEIIQSMEQQQQQQQHQFSQHADRAS